MASSILTGDRRWATTRKSGMTVLGKVPKPINLPSQRLENHGLDPSVEIVPKGTLTWGSRPSSTTPNAWGTSSISSPNTDGSTGSPSHVSGRPSSGGSGTRPSTAGSDKSHEPLSNAWGPNSRPSSASGILTSTQISAAAARPRSAETRPGSSQLSRFADNSADSIGACAWGPPGSAERLGGVPSKASGFTLSSGDFPTLGSEKSSDSHSQRGHSSQGRPQSSQGGPLSSQGRPASASGTNSVERENFEPQLSGSRNVDSLERANVDTWKAENPPYLAHGAPPNMENWNGDPRQPQPYPNMNMPPPQYDSWHNPPFHPADGAWYRGGAAGGPYRPPGPPGSYPIDYVPPRPFVNPQPYPRREAGPSGCYPSCEPYRPHMPPERYMGPSNTDGLVRPGAYPGTVPYEGYYGPPHPSHYNSGDREAPIMGIPRPLVHNQYPNQHPNFDSGNFHARPGEYGTVVNKEQIKHDQVHETQGQYRVLLKQHDGSEDQDEWVNEEHSITSGSAHPQRGNHPGVTTCEGHWETKSRTQVVSISPNIVAGEVVPSQNSRYLDGQSADPVRKSVAGSNDTADDGLLRRPEAADVQSFGQQYPIIRKNASLMEKVEGLNSKARIADGRCEDRSFSSKERTKYFKDATARDNPLMKVVLPNAASTDYAPAFNMENVVPKEINALKEVKNEKSTTNEKVFFGQSNNLGVGENAYLGQKNVHDAKGVDHHPKLRSINSDELTKRTPGSDSLVNPTARTAKVESDSSQEAPFGKRELHHAAGGGDGSQALSSLDPVDQKAQRAKLKEIAMQRAKQLQEEEERRTKEQKAKALAKLEELNRRTLAESSNLKSSNAPPQSAPPQSTDVQNDQDLKPGELPKTTSIEVSTVTLESVNEDDNSIRKPGLVADVTSKACAEPLNSNVQTVVNSQVEIISLGQEDIAEKVKLGTTSDTQNYAVPKPKQVGYRRKQSTPPENSSIEKQPTSTITDSLKDTGEEVSVHVSVSVLSNEDQSVQNRKKHNRNSRNKNKQVDEGMKSPTLLLQPDNGGNSEQNHSESGKTNQLASEAVPASEGPKDSVGTRCSTEEIPDVQSSQVSSESEETRAKGGNHLKPHLHKKTARNQQLNKTNSKYHGTEAVIWAPVKPTVKNEIQEANQTSVIESTNPSTKSLHEMQTGTKAKRAEIERYVPKPVAKELSQQANSQQASGDLSAKPAVGLPQSVEIVKLDQTSIGKAVAPDTRNTESTKHNKHGRTNTSWRQRTSAEPPSVEGSSSKIAEPASNDSLLKGQLTDSNDGWNDNNNHSLPIESVSSTVVAKGSGTSRHRREPYKAHRGRGTNHPTPDNVDSQQKTADKSEHRTPAFGHNESVARNTARAESHKSGGEQMKPHWQPKSQAYGHGRQGNRGTGGHRVASQGIENEDNDGWSQNNTVAGHNQVGGESNIISDASEEQNSLESAPAFGVNQRRQYSGRSQRGHDSNYRVRDSGQESFYPSGDKQKNNPYHEYQRAESYGKPRDSFQQNVGSGEGAHEGTQVHGSHYRERGLQYRRGGRGHLNARGSSSAARGSDSFNGGE